MQPRIVLTASNMSFVGLWLVLLTVNIAGAEISTWYAAEQEAHLLTPEMEGSVSTEGSPGRLLDMFDDICSVTAVRPQLTTERGQLVIRNEATANVWKFRDGHALRHRQHGHPANPDTGLVAPNNHLIGMPLYSGHDPRLALRSPAEPDRSAPLPLSQRPMTSRLPSWEIFFWLMHLGDGYLSFTTDRLAGAGRPAIGFGNGRRPGATVTSGTWLDSPAMQYHLRVTAGGNLTIVNRESGHCLTDRDSLLSRPVTTVVCDPTSELQFWQLCDPAVRRCWPRDADKVGSDLSRCSSAELPEEL